MYADDVNFFLSYSDYNYQRLLQEDLVAPETWCEYNLMRLNLGKSKCMSIVFGLDFENPHSFFGMSFFRRSRIIS